MKTIARDIRVMKYAMLATTIMMAVSFVLLVLITFISMSDQAAKTESQATTPPIKPYGLETREQRARLVEEIVAGINRKQWHALYEPLHPLFKSEFSESVFETKIGTYPGILGVLANPEEIDCVCEETTNGNSCTIRYSVTGDQGATGILTLKTLDRADEVARVSTINLTRKY